MPSTADGPWEEDVLPPFLRRSWSRSLSLSGSHTHTHTHVHKQTLSLSGCRYLSLSLSLSYLRQQTDCGRRMFCRRSFEVRGRDPALSATVLTTAPLPAHDFKQSNHKLDYTNYLGWEFESFRVVIVIDFTVSKGGGARGLAMFAPIPPSPDFQGHKPAAERRKNNLHGFKDFCMKAETRIWP